MYNSQLWKTFWNFIVNHYDGEKEDLVKINVSYWYSLVYFGFRTWLSSEQKTSSGLFENLEGLSCFLFLLIPFKCVAKDLFP